MPATPSRQGRQSQPGSQFLSEIVASNARGARARLGLTQEDLAARMRWLGHEAWSRATVSEVERSGRSVTLDEFLSLGMALDAQPLDLLDPHQERVDLGIALIPGYWLAEWFTGATIRVQFPADGSLPEDRPEYRIHQGPQTPITFVPAGEELVSDGTNDKGATQ